MKAVFQGKHTKLKDRILYYDGDSVVSSEQIRTIAANYGSFDGYFVDSLSTDIKQYNALVPKEQQIHVKENLNICGIEWVIPPEYLALDINQHIADKLEYEFLFNDYTSGRQLDRAIRVSEELDLYESLGLYDVLRTLVYIVDTLEQKKVAWGVGRGSSVSSYVLYLIGVHDVDSVEYKLDIKEFLRK